MLNKCVKYIRGLENDKKILVTKALIRYSVANLEAHKKLNDYESYTLAALKNSLGRLKILVKNEEQLKDTVYLCLNYNQCPMYVLHFKKELIDSINREEVLLDRLVSQNAPDIITENKVNLISWLFETLKVIGAYLEEE